MRSCRSAEYLVPTGGRTASVDLPVQKIGAFFEEFDALTPR
jgi:hypothetical protein